VTPERQDVLFHHGDTEGHGDFTEALGYSVPRR